MNWKTLLVGLAIPLGLGFAPSARAENLEHLRRLRQVGQCLRCDLTNANLMGTNLSFNDLREADLRGADLRGAVLEGAMLDNAQLAGVKLDGATLDRTSFAEVDFSGSDLRLVVLTNADLSRANFSRTNLSGVDLSDTDLERANLSNANLQGAILDDSDLRGANLSNANLQGAKFYKTELIGANLSQANFSRADLRGADLIEVNLTGANLSQANLEMADLTDAQLTGANLTGANLEKVYGYGPNPYMGPRRLFVITETPVSAAGDRLLQAGLAPFRAGDMATALTLWQQALQEYQSAGDRRGEGAIQGLQALAYYEQGRHPLAIERAIQGLAIARSRQDGDSELRLLRILGDIHYDLEDYPTAVNFYQQYSSAPSGYSASARQLHQQEAIRTEAKRGQALLSIGNYPAAVSSSLSAFRIAKQTDNRPTQNIALNTLAEAVYRFGDYEKALERAQQALVLAQETNNIFRASRALGTIARSHLAVGRYDAAEKAAKQLGAIAPNEAYRTQVWRIQGQIRAAQGKTKAAIKAYQQSLALSRALGNRRAEVEILNDLSRAHLQAGNLAEAEASLRAAIAGWDELRARFNGRDSAKVTFFELQNQTFQLLQRVLVVANQPEAALVVAEQARARTFLDLMSARIAGESTNPTINLEQIRQIAREQQATLVQYSLLNRGQPNPCLDQPEICKAFKIESQHNSQESDIFIWVVQPTGEVSFRRVDLAPIWQQWQSTQARQERVSLANFVIASRETIGVRGRDRGLAVMSVSAPQQQQQLRRLHQLLIEPIADLLPSDANQSVIFIPQGPLFLVPFAALPDAEGQALIERHTLLTAPSIQMLSLTRQRRLALERKRKTGDREALLACQGDSAACAIAGNPTMPKVPRPNGQPEQLASLPGAEREARAIAELLKTTPLLGEQAKEAAIIEQIPHARLIHLATHGLLEEYRNALALAPPVGAEPDYLLDANDRFRRGFKIDGLLEASEIMELDIQADLVVLSACDTGRGRITDDGVIGLPRAFIIAGAPSIIVSLWAVPDAPTAQLMTAFYRNRQTGLNKAQALRQAMLTTKQQFPDPKDWAAFTLIGESE